MSIETMDEIVQKLIQARRAKVDSGHKISDEQLKIAIEYMTYDIAHLPVGLGAMIEALNAIRGRLFIIEVTLFVIAGGLAYLLWHS